MTVSIKTVGGIGNILFQISAAYCHAKKHKIDYVIPVHNENPHLEAKHIHFKNVNYSDSIPDLPTYIEPGFSYNEIPYAGDVCLLGYFQSFRYHHQFKEELIKLFDIPVNLNRNVIFIHKRLGDYKHLGEFHQIISDEYIKTCIEYFGSKGFNRFMVFSDEIEEAKKSINSDIYFGAHFEYAEGNTDLEDLSLMASCEGGIMSASTFSWWAAYLGTNENRIILYPKQWFGKALSNHSTKDLCPENWIAV